MNLDDIKIEKELKVIFMGTPDFSVPVLKGLLEKYKVRAVVTKPDKPVGREGKLTFSPIKKLALENTLLVIQPENLRESIDEILSLQPDLIVTCAYGQIVPKAILDYPKYGCINVHASLLPKLRGGAPIHRAIINGFKKTGITIMYMNEGMDKGDIITQEELPILDNDTAETLHDKLSILGRDLLLKTLPSILDGTNTRTKQDESLSSFAFNIKREDERITFSKTKKEIYNQVRGLNSWPGAYCVFEGKILKVWECYQTDNVYPNMFNGQITKIYPDGLGIKVSNGEVVLTTVQSEGKTKMKAIDFVNGLRNRNELIGKVID